MDFAVMGTISSYVKRKNLTFAAKHKIRTGQTLTDAYGNWSSTNAVSTFDKLREAAKTSSTQAKQEKIRRIKQKLRAGQKLSDEELGFLRVNDPKTYKKAKHADEAREELKAELKKAKSKSEAREAMTRAMVKASADAMAELSALGQGGGGQLASSNEQGAVNSANGVADVSQSGAENFSSGEVSTDVNAENQTLADTNQSIQSAGERAAGEVSEITHEATNNHDDKTADKFGNVQKNSDADDLTPEDIMEKYIWTIRALEDEWARFTNSDEYKKLPEHILDKGVKKKIHRQIVEPDRRILNAATAYRKAIELGIRN